MSDLPTFRRSDLEQFFGSNPRLLRAFEEHGAAVEAVSLGVAATDALKDASVIVLSANGEFTNERQLQIGDGIHIEITDNTISLSVQDVARTQDHDVTLVPPAPVILFLPPEGTLISDRSMAGDNVFSQLGTYANDAAAAAGGVPIRGGYINSTTGAVTARLA
jgi:hypothetical protein